MPDARLSLIPFPRLTTLPSSGLDPEVQIFDGPDLGRLIHHQRLNRPGIYISLWPTPARLLGKVGCSYTNLLSRNLSAVHYLNPLEVGRTILITDRNDGLVRADIFALERIAWLQFAGVPNEVALVNLIPDGCPVDQHRYGQLRRFWAECASRLYESGLFFLKITDSRRLAGPRGDENRIGNAFDHSSGNHFLLKRNRLGLCAEVILNSKGDWILTPFSEIRTDVVPSAGGQPAVMRNELRYSGLLRPGRRDGTLTNGCPILFSSPTAAAAFVTGSTATHLALVPIQPKQLERMRLVPVSSLPPSDRNPPDADGSGNDAGGSPRP